MNRLCGILRYGLVFLIAFFSIKSINNGQLGFELVSHSFSADDLDPLMNVADLHGSSIHSSPGKNYTFKIKGKRKVKVRYRAVYCHLKLTPSVSWQKREFFSDRVKFNVPGFHVLHEAAFSFSLRGPPSMHA